jgi:2-alkyl-3-oxoalkanoate reductase
VNQTILVTGAGGFLGFSIAQALRARGHAVRSIARGDYPRLREIGVEAMRGDLTNAAAVQRAVDGVDAVIHVAAKPGIWGPRAEYVASNVTATERVLDACRAARVGKLVYTSSPSVVHNGGDIAGVDESLPYPARYGAHYPETKAHAERLVLAANGPDLATVALRPHLIWGPGDNHLLPRIVARAKAGRLRLVGGGKNLIDTTYIDNAALAHLDAIDRLQPGAACAGRAYFISNDEPRPAAEIINALLAAADVAPVSASIPPRVAWLAGAVCEGLWHTLKLRGEPPMTRFLAEELATAHWFDLSAAKRDLGYAPQVTLNQGFARLKAALAEG